MVAKLVERCGIAVLFTQVAILVVGQAQIVDPWHAPITVVFTLITLLGAVGATLSIANYQNAGYLLSGNDGINHSQDEKEFVS